MTLNLSLKKGCRNTLAVLLLIVFYSSVSAQKAPVPAKTSEPVKIFTQSAYYDAQVIYYALKNFDAFPVYVRTEQQTVSNQAAPAPGAAGAPTGTSGTNSSGQNTGPDAKGGNHGPNAELRGADINYTEPDASAKPGIVQVSLPGTRFSTITVNYYKVVQSSTGNVLATDIAEDDLSTEIAKHPFANDADRNSVIFGVLNRNSGEDAAENKSFAQYKAQYQANAFLSPMFGSNSFNAPVVGGGAIPGLNIIGGLPSVNTIAEGLAGFYIDRINQEVNEAFFIRLQEALTKNHELHALLPNSLACLNKIKVTNYQQSLNALKDAFHEDMDGILHNLTLLGASRKSYQELLAKYPELTLLMTAADVMSMLKDNRTPADIFYRVDTAAYIRLDSVAGPKGSANGLIRLAATLSNSMIDLNISDKSSSNYKWVDPARLVVFSNTQIFQTYMGLICLHLKGTEIKGKAIDGVLFNNLSTIVNSKTFFFNLLNTTQVLTTKIETLKQTPNIADKAAVYLDMTSSLLTLSDDLLKILPQSDAEVKQIQATVAKLENDIVPILKDIIPVVKDVQNHSYSAAIYDAAPLIDKISGVIPTGTSNQGEKDALKALEKLRTLFMQYGPFVSAMAEAKTPEDVKAAINAFALPSGSSRIKKEHTFSWGLNSYVGAYHAWNTDPAKYNLPNTETGITAPMGIALNWALPARAGSLSLYAGVIDIGAIFSYKVNTDKSVQSEIKLGQLLSPSIGVAYGLFMIGKYNIPVSVGVNQQWGPQLKNIDSNGNSVLNSLTSRTNVLIGIDIPIVNFHVSEK